MKTLLIKMLAAILLLAAGSFALKADPPKNGKKPIINKRANPNYDPNKGLLGKPKEQRVIKRNRDEPILKNRKYEPRRFQKSK
jgi:hypothetical protein